MPLKLVRRHGSPYWYVRGSVRGQSVDESTGIADEAAAEAYRAKREWELQQAAVFGKKSVVTFLAAAVAYMEDGGERRFMAPLLRHFGAMKLKDVTQDAIDDAAKLLYPGRARSTVNRQLHTPVACVLRFAAAKGWTDLRVVHRPRQSKTMFRWLTVEEAEALIEASAPHLRPLIVFLLYTGARCSEALLLDWRAVDLARKMVVFLDTKNGSNRGVPLHPRAEEALASFAHRTGRVFLTHKGRPYAIEKGDDHGGQIKTAFRAAVRRAGIAHCRPHDLRHTFATWHYAVNRDLKTLMALGGWEDETSVHRYTHVNATHLLPSITALPGVGTGFFAPHNPPVFGEIPGTGKFIPEIDDPSQDLKPRRLLPW